MNMIGNVVYEENNIHGITGVQKVNLTNLPDGIYFVSVRDKESSMTKKVVIKK